MVIIPLQAEVLALPHDCLLVSAPGSSVSILPILGFSNAVEEVRSGGEWSVVVRPGPGGGR